MRYLEKCGKQWRPKQEKSEWQKQKEEEEMRKEKEEKKEEKKQKKKKWRQKKGKMIQVNKVAEEWEIWDEEEEVKKLV